MNKLLDNTGKNLLENIEEIVERANEHKLGEAFFKYAGPALQAVSRVLGISETQAALFSLVLENADGESVSIGKIGEAMNCGRVRMIKYIDDFEALEKRQLLRSQRDAFSLKSSGFPSYEVPAAVVRALREGRVYRNTAYRGLDAEGFFEEAQAILEAHNQREISFVSRNTELAALFAANQKSAYVKSLKAARLSNRASVHLLAFLCVWLESDVDNISLSVVRQLLGSVEARDMERSIKIAKDDYELVKEGLIDNGNEDGLADSDSWTPTQKTIETFLAEVNITGRKTKSGRNIVKAAAVEERQLFYPPAIDRRVAELARLLSEENFAPIKQRLAAQKMAAAFTILFQGPPGTGKTETAYQLSRLSGRDIFLVDISETKSQWFGESEKRIKEVFSRYKYLARTSALTPILLFNEADAVLGKRQQLGATRTGPAQTENAIQNIILHEMENLKGGILIATTNMTANLDKAFDRRFLYKIDFDRPDAKTRAAIWQDKLEGLDTETALTLSSRYDFSGGQIENIARKHAIAAILNANEVGDDTPLTLEGLAALCEEELMVKTARRIGFGQ